VKEIVLYSKNIGIQRIF